MCKNKLESTQVMVIYRDKTYNFCCHVCALDLVALCLTQAQNTIKEMRQKL